MGANRAQKLIFRGLSMPPLDEDNISAIKVSGKTKRFYDGQGLYLELSRAGGKHWRWKYRFDYKEKRLSFGAWPETKLQDARDMRDKARAILLSGIDPGHQCKMDRLRAGLKTEALQRKARAINRLHEIDLELIRFTSLQAEKQRLDAELADLDKTLNEVALCPLPK